MSQRTLSFSPPSISPSVCLPPHVDVALCLPLSMPLSPLLIGQPPQQTHAFLRWFGSSAPFSMTWARLVLVDMCVFVWGLGFVRRPALKVETEQIVDCVCVFAPSAGVDASWRKSVYMHINGNILGCVCVRGLLGPVRQRRSGSESTPVV